MHSADGEGVRGRKRKLTELFEKVCWECEETLPEDEKYPAGATWTFSGDRSKSETTMYLDPGEREWDENESENVSGWQRGS